MPFAWDLVVFTTMDASQNLAFEEAIFSHKKEPLFEKCDFRIYVDGGYYSNVKLGSGGATLLAIRQLFLEYGQSLFDKRILMIPVGGYSQRQPNCSALGKLFLELPTQGYPTTILDLKLKMYNKFLPYMPPGIFLAASDTVEYYAELPAHLPTLLFRRTGFTLLTFQSSLETAQNHGVFVLNRDKIGKIDNAVEIFGDIRKVLQKPTLQELENENAVIKSDTDYAYIDGLYFMASDVVEKMMKLTNDPAFEIDREICAYSDFLRPLGRENNSDYVRCTLQDILYAYLRNFPAIAVHFLGSKFFHLGTLKDTLNHFCNLESDFARTFDLCQLSNVHLSNIFWCGKNLKGYTNSVKCCAISSVINKKSFIPKLCFIENCNFMMGLEIPDGNVVILSNACSDNVSLIDHSIFATTVPIHDETGAIAYVTIAFEIFEDYKKNLGRENDFRYFGKSKDQLREAWAFVLDCEISSFTLFNTASSSLWYAKLFPSFPKMAESFSKTIEFLNALKSGVKRQKSYEELTGYVENVTVEFYSAFETMRLKDVPSILAFRKTLP